MKLYHFILTFVIIALTIIVIINIRVDNLNTVINNKHEIDRKLTVAIDDAAKNLIQLDANNEIIVSKESAVNSFFTSLYTSFGILSDKEKQVQLSMYIPVIAVTEEDGYYIYYIDEYIEADGKKNTSRRWSEKLPYYYEYNDCVYRFTLDEKLTFYKNGIVDELNYKEMQLKYPSFFNGDNKHFILSEETFELVRKESIKNCIEETMSYYTSIHNRIASQYGITYNFVLPSIKDDQWLPYLNNISIFVVFQGYPYGNEAYEVYNRFGAAGAKISKNQVYYIEQVDWYLVYHKSDCPELKDAMLYDNKVRYSIKECVSEGAYGCEKCLPNEIHAPYYKIY